VHFVGLFFLQLWKCTVQKKKPSNLTFLQTLTRGLHSLILRLRSRTRHLWLHFPKCLESGLWVPCSYVQQYSSYLTFKCQMWEKVPPCIIDLLSHFRWSSTPMQFQHVIMLIMLSVRVWGRGSSGHDLDQRHSRWPLAIFVRHWT